MKIKKKISENVIKTEKTLYESKKKSIISLETKVNKIEIKTKYL